MWIADVAFLALLALCFFAYCKYERWLAKKLNPYVVAYQSDHNLEKLKQGLYHWRPWAFSKHSQNIITANWFSALLEQKRWAEAEETLEQFLRRAKSTQDKMGYHLLRGDDARAIGDPELEEQERDSILGSFGAGLFILSLFSFPVCLIWLILWLIRRRKEAVK